MHRPVEPRRDLLDMGRLAGAVIALDHYPAVAGETGADRHGRVGIEHIGRIEVGNPLVGLGEGRNFQVAVDPERVAHLHHLVGRGEDRIRSAVERDVGNFGHASGLRRFGKTPQAAASWAFSGMGKKPGSRAASFRSPSTSIEDKGAPA